MWLAAGVEEAAAGAALGDLPAGEGRHHLVRVVAGVRAMVKVYNRRGKHGVVRRLRAGRSVREARGYAAFGRAGIRTPRILMWGERRRWWLLHESGVIVTEMVDAVTVAEAVKAGGGGVEWLEGCARELAVIHGACLAHGDPRTRNFLAVEDEGSGRAGGSGCAPMAFDLCSWGRLTEKSREWDLVQMVGSAMALTGDAGVGEAMVRAYEGAGGSGGGVRDAARVMREAAAYAQREGAA